MVSTDNSDPYKCGALTTSGQWIDPKGSGRTKAPYSKWQPDGCLLRSYNPKKTASCLKTASDRGVTFIGVSVLGALVLGAVRNGAPIGTLVTALPVLQLALPVEFAALPDAEPPNCPWRRRWWPSAPQEPMFASLEMTPAQMADRGRKMHTMVSV